MSKYTLETALLLNICYIIIGITIIRTERAKNTFNSISKIILGIIPILFGLATLIVGVILNSEQLIMKISLCGSGLVLVDLALVKLINNMRCDTLIEAAYVDRVYYNGYRGEGTYAPIFRYIYNGVEYKSEAKQYYTESLMRAKFGLKRKYNIYICSKEPELCVVDRKIKECYLGIGIGILIFLLIVKTSMYR